MYFTFGSQIEAYVPVCIKRRDKSMIFDGNIDCFSKKKGYFFLWKAENLVLNVISLLLNTRVLIDVE